MSQRSTPAPWGDGPPRDHSWSVFGLVFGAALLTAVLVIWFITRGPAPANTHEGPPSPVSAAAAPIRVLEPPPGPDAASASRGRRTAAPGVDARVLPTGPDGVSIVPELAEEALQLNAAGSTIERDFEILDTLVAFYRNFHAGENPPGGENDEIVAQLTGHNPARLAVLPPDHPSIDRRGRLLDRWGTPFYFHPVNYEVLEMTSAGPDKLLWTADDIRYEPLE